MEQIQDLLTGEFFTPKRSDQRFANRENHIRYNNEKAKKKRKAKAFIDQTLDTNRNILKRILGNHSEIVKSKEFLLGAGFNFGYITHKAVIDNVTWSCFYDYAIVRVGKDRIKIIRQ